MKATIRDAAVLAALMPLDVVSYLRSGGWTKTEERPQKSSTWTKSKNHDDFEVVVPLSTQLSDYPSRISDALRVLEVVEERSQLSIYRDLLVTSADVLRIRLIDSDFSDGTVPLEEGAEFFGHARDMVLAAACSTAQSRAYFPSRKPTQAIEYVRRARLGQTEQQSFVLMIISRVPPSLASSNGHLFEPEEPFERRVTRTLASGLVAVEAASTEAASTGQVTGFVQGVSRGVSANLCHALAGMGTSGGSNRFLEVQFTWSRTRPTPEHGLLRSIRFSPDAFPILDQAAIYLKETSPREEYEILGPVVRLDRSEGARTGKVTVHGFVDDQPRKIIVELPDPEYHLAVTAHGEKKAVRCSGVLVREGRSFTLREPYGFTVESDE